MDIEDKIFDADNALKDELPATDSIRRVMNLYYLVDTSGSMVKEKIESINQVMPEVVELVKEISDNNADAAEIKVACLCFSTGAHWMYSAPMPAADFKWVPCCAAGLTDLGRAYDELEKHLHKASDLGNTQGHFAPAVILLTDGAPTDDFESAYKRLMQNNWFKHATKVAIAIGTQCDNKVLIDFVGEKAAKEAILTVHDAQTLKDVIRLVSCSVSKVGSSNVSTDQKTKEEQLAEEITGNLGGLPNGTTEKDGVLDIKPIGDDLFA